jgi:lipopolysaccharide transport system ATP-binding protein
MNVVAARGVSKLYRLGHDVSAYPTLRDALVGRVKRALSRDPAPPASRERLWALRDVSFDVEEGEVLGIIGKNGAGKSTLLKVLSRITPPTEGRITLHGRVGSLLEVGTGFHPELTGRENIALSAAILGMSRVEIRRKFDDIVAFAEVERFIDTPVKHYSSGMYLRLAFAVAAHIEPEILVVDEVLAVGDAAFQRKCLGRMSEVASRGRTILFVSHNMAAIRTLCGRAIWIDEGQLRMNGPAPEVIDAYLRDTDRSGGQSEIALDRNPDKGFQLLRARLVNDAGQATQSFECDEAVVIELGCEVRQTIPGLYGYLTISRLDGTDVLESDSFDAGANPLDGLPPGQHFLRIRVPPRTLGHGDYRVYLSFTSRSAQRGFEVDVPGTILAFRLDDHASRRGNARRGFLSAIPLWEMVARG